MNKVFLTAALVSGFIVFQPFSPSMSHAAGREVGNGADGVRMGDGTVRLLDLVRSPETLVLDIEAEGLDAELLEVLKRHPGFGVSTYFPYRSALTSAKTTSLQDAIVTTLRTLDFKLVRGPLPEVGDRGIVEFKKNIEGTIQRLALQLHDQRLVLVDAELYGKLPRTDQVAMVFHETLIRLWKDDYKNSWEKLGGTEKIASIVQSVFDGKHSLSARSLSKIFCDAEFSVAEKSTFGLRPLEHGWMYVKSPELNQKIPRSLVSFGMNLGRCESRQLEPIRTPQQDRIGTTVLDGVRETYYGWLFRDVESSAEVRYFVTDSSKPGASSFLFSTNETASLEISDNAANILKYRLMFWIR